MADEPAEHEHDEHPAGEHDGKPGDGKDGKPGKAGEQSYLKKHRDMIIVALTMVGVIIGYLSLKGGKSSTAATDPSTLTDPAGAGVNYTGGTTAGQSFPGDGGASDGFSAYLSNMSDQLNAIESALATGTASTGTGTATPTPFDTTNLNQSWAAEPSSTPAHFLYGKSAAGLRYIRDLSKKTGSVGQVNPNGSIYWLNLQQYTELGSPKYTSFGKAPTPAPKPKAKT